MGNAVAALPAGRREANKREKLARIREAARAVFLRDGYEAATARDIATRAGVADGTLFLYAKDKTDLLLLLFEEENDALTERALRQIDRDGPFVDQLIAFFREFYRFFARMPELSRQMMTGMTFNTGMVAMRVREGVQRTEESIARFIAEAQAGGVLATDVAPELAAHMFFNLYRMEIRACLAHDRPDTKGSLETLRQQFEIVYAGLQQRQKRKPARP
jgi:AcrR family transcriptional regulator